jgi:hypothetical protein
MKADEHLSPSPINWNLTPICAEIRSGAILAQFFELRQF